MLHLLQWLHTYVACVRSKYFICFRCMLQVFHLCVAKVVLDVHLLQWMQTYVASVYSKCFICFRRMLQVFHLSVTKVDLHVDVEEAQAISGRAATRAVWRLLVLEAW
jgi:cystathionine beta-lyase/cystathionine gamma-synthase